KIAHSQPRICGFRSWRASPVQRTASAPPRRRAICFELFGLAVASEFTDEAVHGALAERSCRREPEQMITGYSAVRCVWLVTHDAHADYGMARPSRSDPV